MNHPFSEETLDIIKNLTESERKSFIAGMDFQREIDTWIRSLSKEQIVELYKILGVEPPVFCESEKPKKKRWFNLF